MRGHFNLTLILKSKCSTCIDKIAISHSNLTESCCLPFFLSFFLKIIYLHLLSFSLALSPSRNTFRADYADESYLLLVSSHIPKFPCCVFEINLRNERMAWVHATWFKLIGHNFKVRLKQTSNNMCSWYLGLE